MPETNIAQSEKSERRERVSKTLFDTDFFEDPKIIDIEDSFGPGAPSAYQRVVFAVLKTGAPVARSSALALIKRSLPKEVAEAFLEHCLSISLLYFSNGLVSSKRADFEIEIITGKRKEWREKNERRKGCAQELLASNSERTEEEGEEELEDLKILEKGVQGEKPFVPDPPKPKPAKKPPPEQKLYLPEPLERWISYRKKIGKPLKPPTIEQILKTYQGREAELLRDVEHSIGQGYQGIYPPKNNGPSPPPPGRSVSPAINVILDSMERLKKYEQ